MTLPLTTSGGGIFSALADTPNCPICWIRALKAGMSIGAAAIMAATCSHLPLAAVLGS